MLFLILGLCIKLSLKPISPFTLLASTKYCNVYALNLWYSIHHLLLQNLGFPFMTRTIIAIRKLVSSKLCRHQHTRDGDQMKQCCAVGESFD
uniref:Uncharacterized protein n=1 Tax=Octopus bimaculoides TaxID=37653 RepID=A0A0L8HIQ6_OCTBM